MSRDLLSVMEGLLLPKLLIFLDKYRFPLKIMEMREKNRAQ